MNLEQPNQAPDIAVYFDGGCPMCAKEIAYYRRLDTRNRVQWVDVAGPNPSCPVGYDQQTLLARFHVQDVATGKYYDGAAGFARLWQVMPAPWQQLGIFASLAPMTWLLELGYRITLKVRPIIAKRLQDRP
jgi:predicted DCC family thiol-disulfide oxidoreductase YuxK